MPKLVDSVEQRREIRSAARRVFARRGVAGTGLTHVAQAAGMGRSSLYHYYPDKAALMRDLLCEVMGEEESFFAAAGAVAAAAASATAAVSASSSGVRGRRMA